MKKNYKCTLAIIFLITISLILNSSCNFFRKTPLLDMIKNDSSLLVPFLSYQLKELDKSDYQENGVDLVNYWNVSARLITNLYVDISVSKTSEDIIEQLMNTFKTHGYFPRPAYDGFEYGWVSSMDAPVVALACQMAFELSGENKYKEYVEQLIPYLKQTIDNKGYIMTLEDGNMWLLEYASADLNEENAWFVLNGSLVGALASVIIADIYQDEELQTILDKQTQAYKAYSDKFFYNNNTWCYYMLNPKTVNQPHYVIFESKLFKSLSLVSDDSYYQEEYEQRIDLLKNNLPVYAVENSDNTINYTLLRAIAPHPYYIDIYDTDLDFYDDNNTLLKSDKMGGNSIHENIFLSGTLPNTATNATFTSTIINDLNYLNIPNLPIYMLTPEQIKIPNPIDFNLIAQDDAQLLDDKISLSDKYSDNAWGSLYLELNESISVDYKDYYAFEINNLSDNSIYSSIMFKDTLGNTQMRYLKPLKPGKNLYLLNILGFIEQEKSLENISVVQIRLYTDDIVSDTITIEVNDFRVFSNSMSLEEYINNSDYTINQGP